ncbi:hypothetical protein HanXRQr2_Chr17g0786971 [Helianthus annuus]|nr:hypothetical protein HanXRQr2_Chr17g0786971 [Helianthus annuus]
MAKRIRINWKQEGVEKTFLEACVHEITVNGREGSSLKQASWKCNIYDQLFMDYDENTMFHEMQSGENDGLLVQDIEWGSQGIDYMTSLRNQIANQLLSNESN